MAQNSQCRTLTIKKKKKRKRKKKKNGNENAAKEFNSNWYNDYSWLGYFVEEETTSCYG